MSEPNSTASGKPSKPSPNFPLFPHAFGQWAEKIRGKMHYFGKWDDPDTALDSYEKQKDALHAGPKPREQGEGTTVKDLVNAFLNQKEALVQSCELLGRTWKVYRADVLTCAFERCRGNGSAIGVDG